MYRQPIPVVTRSQAWVCGRSLAGIVSSNPTGGIDIRLLWVLCVVCWCLCVGPITRPEESYRVWCVWVWSWIIDNDEALARWRLLRHGKRIIIEMCAFLGIYVISSVKSVQNVAGEPIGHLQGSSRLSPYVTLRDILQIQIPRQNSKDTRMKSQV
jgi:hypothetical protein